MNLIDNNPYRILGVYANSPLRERVANASKARAFLKVGRSVSFPLDLPDILHPLNRTEESFAQAESSVALPSEQLRYALFWFIRMSVVDDVAMKNLTAGDLSAAEDVWRKRECMASAHNLIVYALVRDDLKLAVKYAEIFFSNRDYVSQFAQVVVGDDSSCGDLATIFLDALCEEVDAEDVYHSLGDCELREMASQKVTDKYVECIEGSLSETRQAHGVACLKAGEDLLECAEDWLSCLSDELKTLSISDIRYQSLCEKVSSEVIRCAQEYYRASTDDEKAQNAIGLLSAPLLRGTAKKNEGIKNEVSKLLSFLRAEQEKQKIAKPLAAIDAATKEFMQNKRRHVLGVHFFGVTSFLIAVKPHLVSIKNTIGETPFYLNKSTECVSLAFAAMVDEFNCVQKTDLCRHYIFAKMDLVRQAIEVVKTADAFDMTSDYRMNYEENRATLFRMKQEYEYEYNSMNLLDKESRRLKWERLRKNWLWGGALIGIFLGGVVIQELFGFSDGRGVILWLLFALIGAFVGYIIARIVFRFSD